MSDRENGNGKSEFWVPPEFLTEEDIVMDLKPKHYSNNTNSGLNSPVDSFGSSSSESEEEHYLAELTRKMANSTTLLHHFFNTHTHTHTLTPHHKNWGISVSPQSTLYGLKEESSWNCISPPSLPLPDRKDSDFELLYLAAGEVAKMRMIEEANAAYIQNRGGFNTAHAFPYNQNLTYHHHLQFAKFQQLKREQLKREQLMRQQQQQAFQMAATRGRPVDRPPIANLPHATWPTLQQSFQPQSQQQSANAANGSGMRPVFLAPKRDSVGTGVFIPRRTDQPRKASGCSTVLLPDRVVQAINLNSKPMDAHSHLNNALTTEIDGAVNIRNRQKMNIRPSSVAAHSDLRLPQEWTY